MHNSKQERVNNFNIKQAMEKPTTSEENTRELINYLRDSLKKYEYALIEEQNKNFRLTKGLEKLLSEAKATNEKQEAFVLGDVSKTVCDNPHCVDGIVGEIYGEKIYCHLCRQ